ncbi:3-hydroxybutyryl-CoA dehydrogenase [Paraburkholderia nemoris]|uniref:L-gulonate 3-dehydrogenase n=1 Tax=Paraburkholderia nemoris TaxID=2793076 RepID=A0ABM8QTJ2_9BURK|nr:3-hydroxybutyryl-CoA dehydrogenase [Burkholderia sp. ST111]MBK3738623.1 3-hydroxyacyl-CoA dehydrogenase family protein [Paraburkholderia aspalathi]CAE6702008.1 3-hydroxybutyryl-CoA dehydrogenase [Paraburkholderia nemoris]MBK3779001.1 3-hydroxyacyl-CoA dehydrogenase family protein [Paraburkholderia aspalathi]MBK3809516.1 3-hydroxyacyl-CoA dehydrogenase family protein [Paraburkholderia aspalathi]
MDKAVIGVVGTGLMGVGIATQSALHGHRTIVHDVDPARLASVAPKAEAVLDELIDAGRIDHAAKQAALARIETHAQLDVMASAQFVIEAIPEVLELKHRLYAALAELMANDAILASNTSGFPPDQLVAPLRAKERFLIAHFWNPPHMIPLVEVVPGTATAPEVTERTAALMSAIGMEPVVLAKAIPGFVGNRLQFAVLREALNIVRSGAATPDVVDRVMKASLGRRWGIVGPLEGADMGGLDTFLDISTHLMPELAKDEDVLDLLRAQVNAGRVGVRSGAGFYEWDDAHLARVKAGRKQVISRG